MSARSVWSGTRPSRYHSLRAISAPPSRPPQLMRMPCAPSRIADCTARFMARRNATRRSSCWAIDCATRCESISGFLTSTILMCTSDLVIEATFLRSFSMSAPFLPMTMPGRAVWMVTRHFLCGRSTTTFDTAACFRSFISAPRMRTSSCSRSPYSVSFAYQRESQVLLIPRRSPTGLTFCPMLLQPFGASSTSRTTMVRFEKGFRMRPTRPRARGLKRFIASARPTCASATTRLSTSS